MIELRGPKGSEGGFTLVELMIVVLIIGILVSIAVAVYAGSRSNSEKAVCQANLRTIDSAIAPYYVENGSYPDDIAQLVPVFLKEEPHCPAGGIYSLDHSEEPPYARCSLGHTYTP